MAGLNFTGYNSLPFEAQSYAGPGQSFSFDNALSMNYGRNPSPIDMSFFGLGKDTESSPWSMEGAFGKFGWAPHAINAASGLMQGFIGMKQYGLGKQQLAENKRQFNMNFDTQRTLTNSQLRDRQRARVASNPGAYESVDAYMNQNGI